MRDPLKNWGVEDFQARKVRNRISWVRIGYLRFFFFYYLILFFFVLEKKVVMLKCDSLDLEGFVVMIYFLLVAFLALVGQRKRQ